MKREIKYWIFYILLVVIVGATVSSMGYDYSTYQKWVIIICCVLCTLNGIALGTYIKSESSKKEGK